MIYCTADEKAYIGSTRMLYARLSSHKVNLGKGVHRNPHLQSAYKLYGSAAFHFLVVERTETNDPVLLLERENHYLLQLPRDTVFNTIIPAIIGGPVGVTRSPEHRAAISRAHKGNKYRLGWVPDAEWRARISAQFKGKKHTPEQIEAARAGKKAALEKNPMMYKGTRNGRAKLTEDDVREIRRLYATNEWSQTALAKKFGINQKGISEIVRGKKWGHVK